LQPLSVPAGAVASRRQHAGEIAGKLDLQASVLRDEPDRLDQATDRRRGLHAQLRPVQLLMQAGDLVAIDLGEIGMEADRGRGRLGESVAEVRLARLQRQQLFLRRRRAQALLERLDDGPDLAFDPGVTAVSIVAGGQLVLPGVAQSVRALQAATSGLIGPMSTATM
jgi:hypothetical protein